MNAFARCLAAGLVLATAVAIPTSAWAKGSGGGGKTSGWSLSPTPSSGSTMAGLPIGDSTGAFGGGKGRGNVQGYDALGNAGTMGMGSMMITPNGMIARNTQPMTVPSVDGLAGSSSVSKLTRGEGNSQVGLLAQGVGNSQGSGGTVDIAQMTHFGVSGIAFASSIIGTGGVNIGSLLSQFLNNSPGAPPALPGGGSGASSPGASSPGAHAAMKAQLLGAPTNHACVSTAGAKSGCG